MNSASIRESIVTLRSVVRVVAYRVSSSSLQSVRNANSVQRRCYSAFKSFRSSERCWCLVEARRSNAIEIGSRSSAMSGRANKHKKKGSKKQGQSQNVAPDVKPGPDKSESIAVEAGSAGPESQSPKGEKQVEAVLAEESTESAAVGEIHPTKADNNKPESPVVGGTLAVGEEQQLEKNDTTEGDSPLKPTTGEETIAKSDAKGEENVTLTSSTVESDEALKQSLPEAVDHQGSQPADETEDDMMTDNGNKESRQIKGNKDLPKFGSPAPVGSALSSETNKDSPSKIGSTHASDQGKSAHKQDFYGDRKRQETNTYYGTRNATVMKERERYLAMTPKEKRRFYAKRDITELADIDTWTDFYSTNERALKKVRPEANHIKGLFKGNFPPFEADDEINAKVSLFEGDITNLEIDGIVNAANSSLLGGGGVDGAIHRAAGSPMLDECRTLNGCRTGDAKTTCGYKLPAKYVIHTVGPQGNYPNDLRNCYARCLDEMLKNNMRTLAFCCISTGIYGYPNELAVHVALNTVRDWLSALKQKNQLQVIDRIIFCLFLPVDIRQYQTWMQAYFPIPGAYADKRVPEKTKDNKVPSDSHCPTKEGKDEGKPKSSASDESTRPAKQGKGQDKLESAASDESTHPGKESKDEVTSKSSTSGQESASMEVEEPTASEEDMEAEGGSASSSQVGGIVSPDKKCKLDHAGIQKVDLY